MFNTNPFALFNIPVTLFLDEKALDHQYQQAQRIVNPDQYVGKTDFEKRLAMEQAIRLNQAYQALKDPLSRAKEILKINHIPIPGDQGTTIQYPDLLLEMMEWQECLNSCDSSEHLATLQEKIRTLQKEKMEAFDRSRTAETYLHLVYFTKLIDTF